jgi:hypothetical protein
MIRLHATNIQVFSHDDLVGIDEEAIDLMRKIID